MCPTFLFFGLRKLIQIGTKLIYVTGINYGMFGIENKMCNIYSSLTGSLQKIPFHDGLRGYLVEWKCFMSLCILISEDKIYRSCTELHK